MCRTVTALLLALCMINMPAAAGEHEPRTKVEIDVTTIRTTKELPGLLYIVPWQEAEIAANTGDREIVIHELFGDFFQPMVPATSSESSGVERKEQDGLFPPAMPVTEKHQTPRQ